MALPAGWQRVIRESAAFDGDLKGIGDGNPMLGKYFKDAFANSGDQRLKLLAVDPNSVSLGFVTNVNIMVADLGRASAAPDLGALASARRDRLGRDDKVASLVSRKAVLPAGPAAEIDYKLKAGAKTAAIRSYLLIRDQGGMRRLFELTMGTVDADVSSLFGQFASSFGFTPRAAAPSPAASPLGAPG